MAIGTTAAIGLGVAGVGAIAGASSANKAAKRAAQVSEQNNAANVALQREIYGKNQQALSPFMQLGKPAGDTINALLGLGGASPQYQQPQVTPNALSQFAGGTRYGRISIPALYNDGYPAGAGYGIADGQAGLGAPFYSATRQNPIGAQDAANNAFDIFRNSTGYQFRLNEGMDALNSGYAGAGILQSGDAMRAAQEYGQNFASNEFGNYMGYLANQQGVGLSGASALAGVGQNYANNITAMNTQNAANQANALLSRQNPLANVAGMIGGGLFNYGMGKL